MSTRRIIGKLIRMGETESVVEEMDRPQLMEKYALYLLGDLQPSEEREEEKGYDPVLETMKMEQHRVLKEREWEEAQRRHQEWLYMEREKKALEEKRMAEARALEEIRIAETRALEEKRLQELKESRQWELEKLQREEEQQRLKIEMRQKELDIKMAELDARTKELEKEEEIRQEALQREEDIRRQTQDVEQARHLDRLRVKEASQKVQLDNERRTREDREKPGAQLKFFGNALRATLTPMSEDVVDCTRFFAELEHQFTLLEVPERLQAMLVRPFLNRKARTLLSQADPSIVDEYALLKSFICRELKLTARRYYELFKTCRKDEQATFNQFANRLRSILSAYLECRAVTEFKDLISLLVADRLKESVDGTAIGRHIMTIETAKGEGGWLSDKDLAVAMDVFAAAKPSLKDKDGASSSSSSSLPYRNNSRYAKWRKARGRPSANPNENEEQRPRSSSLAANAKVDSTASRDISRGKSPTPTQNANKKPGACWVCGKIGCRSFFHSRDGSSKRNDDRTRRVNRIELSVPKRVHFADQTVANDDQVEFSRLASVDVNCASVVNVTPEELDYLDLEIRENKISEPHIVRFLTDSGSEVTLANSRILTSLGLYPEAQGNVFIKGILGDSISATLAWLYLSLPGHESIPILTACSNEFNENFVIPVPICSRLAEAPCRNDRPAISDNLIRPIDNADAESDSVEFSDGSDDDLSNCNRVISDEPSAGGDCIDCITTSDIEQADKYCVSTVTTRSQSQSETESMAPLDSPCGQNPSHLSNIPKAAYASDLQQEQADDPSLSRWRNLAERNEHGFYFRDGILYRWTNIQGQEVEQLCLPDVKRYQAFKLAHDSAHLGAEKTQNRLALSFAFPGIKDYCKRHVNRCDICQRKKRLTYLDRVPITPVERAELVNTHFFLDCLGPMIVDANAPKPRYNYAVVLVDSCSRFPFCTPLSSMTAKSVCAALLDVFALTGVPLRISCDCGSNFTAQLTQELLARLGCRIRFSTPYHPRGCGLVERMVGSIKSIVNKLASEHPRSWHNYIPFALWALREVPNGTTGVSPFLMVYGRLPTSPCKILAETWTQTASSPLDLAPNVVDYLLDLKSKLEKSLDLAREHSDLAQGRYAAQYNKRARDKSFYVGDEVLILAPHTMKSKTMSRWQGPGRVLEVLAPYSYLIELNGVRQRVHADRLRHYLREVESLTTSLSHMVDISETDNPSLSSNTCAVVMEDDKDFGEVVTVETQPTSQLPSARVSPERLAHLSIEQKAELLEVLDRYACVFCDKPGFTDAAVHRIELTSDFRPKRLPEYRIPERLKAEVDRQITEMLQMGIIRPSTSPMASPVVCVLKGPQGRDGVRLANDYRYINKYTVPDQFPVPNMDDLIQEIGNSKYLTLCDAKSGYWQCGIAEGEEWKTAFICNANMYEYTRVPFGLRNAGSTFCRAMQEILHPIRHIVKNYIDDLILGTTAWKSHINNLEIFLKTIKQSGVTLSLKKCRFGETKLRFCGRIVGSGSWSADPEKTRALQDMQRPTTQTELRRVIGSFNYFRDSIPHYAEVALPLTNLLGKGKSTKLQWGEVEEKAWNHLKAALIAATNRSMAIIDWSKPFIIECDTSNHTISGCLLQSDSHEINRPIAFYSNKLNSAQMNYAVIEKEALAAIVALNKFKGWIFGSPEVVLYSDHNPLLYLTQAAPKSAKLTRWALALQVYPLVWKYKKGRTNWVADCLTRQPTNLGSN